MLHAQDGQFPQRELESAYERIKRQGNGLFKTSPKHAAVMMTESVVTKQDKFQDCGKYLGRSIQAVKHRQGL